MIFLVLFVVLFTSCAHDGARPLDTVTISRAAGNWKRITGPGGSYSFELPAEPEARSIAAHHHLYRFPRSRPGWERFVVEVQRVPTSIERASALDAELARLSSHYGGEISRTSTSADVREISFARARSKLVSVARIRILAGRIFTMIATSPEASVVRSLSFPKPTNGGSVRVYYPFHFKHRAE